MKQKFSFKTKMRPFPAIRATHHGRWGKKVKEYESLKEAIRIEARAQGFPLNSPDIRFLEIEFIFAVSKSWPKWKKDKNTGGPHTFKPDLDNCVKAVVDSLFPQGDEKIAKILSLKKWGNENTISVIAETRAI